MARAREASLTRLGSDYLDRVSNFSVRQMDDRPAAQILAVGFDQVKGAQDCLVAMPGPADELENR
jgi:hypothetical protein